MVPGMPHPCRIQEGRHKGFINPRVPTAKLTSHVEAMEKPEDLGPRKKEDCFDSERPQAFRCSSSELQSVVSSAWHSSLLLTGGGNR
jgi:hypothetical protein